MAFKKPNPHTYRSTPASPEPIDPARVAELTRQEWDTFKTHTGKSGIENQRSKQSLPLGVTSSFQHWDPYPISIASAKGAWMKDVDGRDLLDLSMGFGAMLAGHLNPVVIEEIQKSLDHGTLFVTPTPISTDAAEMICTRFNIDQVRFCNSGTEAAMYAVRVARAVSGKLGIVKVEGGYHGSYDPFTVSSKPAVLQAGPVEDPTPVVPNATVPGEVHVVPYNNAEALQRVFEKHHDTIACFIVEPVLENIGIVVPDAGYLEAVRELCDRYNVILIFDEVKTGLTAGPQGAAQRFKIDPDLICLAKSIGGGIPLAAFGGKRKFMQAVSSGSMPHFGTFNGNPLAMAGVRAMERLATDASLGEAEAFNMQALQRITALIDQYKLPAHTVGFGVKGCVTWSATPVRNYRDYKATDFDVAELSWLWSLNRGVITPPGLDEQWLISLAHGQREVDILVDRFEDLATALRS